MDIRARPISFSERPSKASWVTRSRTRRRDLLLIAPHKYARGFGGSTAGPSHSETWAAPDPRSAKVLFVPCPSVISYPALHGHDPGGGAHGNSHPTTRIYTRTGWRGGHLASRSAGAAGADACSRISALGVSAKLRTA